MGVQQKKDDVSSAIGLEIRVLIVSREMPAIKSLTRLLQESAIHVEVTPTEEAAIHQLCRKKYEAIIVDIESFQDSLRFFRKQRATTSNRTAVVWGIVKSDKEMSGAFRAGANFALVRPLSQSALVRTLKASYPLMAREKRRYHREPMAAQVFAHSSVHSEFIAFAINISENGMAFEGAIPLDVGEKLDLRFKLPGSEEATSLIAEVCWFDNDGRVGLHFVMVSERMRQQIQRWIAERLDPAMLITIE